MQRVLSCRKVDIKKFFASSRAENGLSPVHLVADHTKSRFNVSKQRFYF